VCVHIFALVIRHGNRISSDLCYTAIVDYLAVPGFSALVHKRHDFLKKIIEHTMCILILSTTFV